jgi:glycosyltransferase involved in cell wall biosynthesis
MKLLYITNGINGAGGLERVLSVKASYLADQYDYEVHILVLNDNHLNPFYEFSPKIQFHSISVSGSPLTYFQSYKKGIQKTVDQIQPDIVSVCDDGLKGFLIPRIIKTSAKLIYERHVSKLIEANTEDSFLKTMAIKIKWTAMEQLGKKYDKFVVLTDGNQKEWQSLQNLIVIPNPLSFMPEESAELNNKVVICVGKISYQKGQDLLVKAWEIVHQKHPDWQLHLYGKENLEFLDTNNLKDNVLFFPPEKDIQQKYLDSSIYIMSSRFEGFGMVLTEAMACGVPCVSFNCNYGPSDIIKDGVDGLLVEKENTNELAEKISILIESDDLRYKMGTRAKENVQRFSPTQIVNQWDILFKEIKK